MEQALKAYKLKESTNDRGFIEEDGHTWADVQAALSQSSTPLSEKISKVASNIAGIYISNQVDSTKDSSTHVAIAWGCVRMMLNVATVSSKPYFDYYNERG